MLVRRSNLMVLVVGAVIALGGSAYPPPAWGLEEIARLTPTEDPGGSHAFGFTVAISGDDIAVSAVHDPPFLSGAAYVFVREGLNWVQEGKVKASEPRINARFGRSLGIDGGRMVVGAPDSASTFPSDWDIGLAYVFRREGNRWIEEASLISSGSREGDMFGSSVDIDGDWVVVGAPGGGFGVEGPAAYVFQRQGTLWVERARLTAADPSSWSDFGYSVALDGDLAVIGARRDDGSAIESGSAYVFRREGLTWAYETKLGASDGAQRDRFGRSVDVGQDLIVVGAHADDDGGASSGSAYVFRRKAGVWAQEFKLTAHDAATSDDFGVSVAINSEMVVVGAQNDDTAAGENSGSAYVFRPDAGMWAESEKLAASDAHVGHALGASVALDAQCAVVGAARAAYVYWLGPPEDDCNHNCVDDAADISGGTSIDCDDNGTPDECESLPDADADGVSDCYDQCPGADDNLFGPDCSDAVPTVSGWGMVVLVLLLVAGGKIVFSLGGAWPSSARPLRIRRNLPCGSVPKSV